MSRIFVVTASLLIFGALAQAQQPYGSTPIVPYGQDQYDGLYAPPLYDGGNYGMDNYVETPDYGDENSYGENNDGDYQERPQRPPNQGRPDSDEMERIHQAVLEATNGACNIKENPHSFGCTEWTFTNNPVFPLFQMDWRGLQGEWFTVTYANPVSGNRGREFYMGLNANRPTQPFGGVRNTKDDSKVGRLSINGTQVTFENWRGRPVSSDPASFRVIDNYTVQFDMWTGRQGQQTLHSFNCRDFNRNSEHHLLCDWSVKTGPGNRDWLFKGYFGFISLAVWESFRPE